MDADEFDRFYLASVNRLVGALYAMTGDLAEAQDVVQEAFVRAWDNRSRLEAFSSPEAWVRTVARRLAISRWRRAQNAITAWQRHGPPPSVDAPALPNPELMAALRKLPATQRHAIVLFYVCDRSIEQIAAEMQTPSGTVKARLARGRAALARYLTPDQPALDRPAPDRPTSPGSLSESPAAGRPDRSDRYQQEDSHGRI